jgi:hypothetical protein
MQALLAKGHHSRIRPGDGTMLQKLRIWWQLRKLEKDRAFLLRIADDPRSQELLPLVEAEIARLRASQIKLRHPEIFKDEGRGGGHCRGNNDQPGQ